MPSMSQGTTRKAIQGTEFSGFQREKVAYRKQSLTLDTSSLLKDLSQREAA